MCIIAALLFTACSSKDSSSSRTSEPSSASSNAGVKKSDVLAAYQKVNLGMTKEQIDTALGLEAKKETSEYAIKNTYNYVDPNTDFGVSVVYNDKNIAFSKTAMYDSHKDIAPLCKSSVKEDQKSMLSNGMNYKEVIKVLGGEGVEVNATATGSSPTALIGIIRRWANSDGSGFQISFSNEDKVSDVSYFNHD